MCMFYNPEYCVLDYIWMVITNKNCGAQDYIGNNNNNNNNNNNKMSTKWTI